MSRRYLRSMLDAMPPYRLSEIGSVSNCMINWRCIITNSFGALLYELRRREEGECWAQLESLSVGAHFRVDNVGVMS